MPLFLFVVQGPPVSVNAKDKQTRKYQNWIRTVREAARLAWSETDMLSSDVEIEVCIINYHTLPPLDVDNVVKPVLDGMNGVVYADDSQVWRVVSERIAIAGMTQSEEVVRAAANRYAEFLAIEVRWEEM